MLTVFKVNNRNTITTLIATLRMVLFVEALPEEDKTEQKLNLCKKNLCAMYGAAVLGKKIKSHRIHFFIFHRSHL